MNLGLAAWQHLVGRAIDTSRTAAPWCGSRRGSLDLRPALASVAILVWAWRRGARLLQSGAALLSLTIGQDLLSRLRSPSWCRCSGWIAYHLRHGIGEMG